jgi:hypothetical protein
MAGVGLAFFVPWPPDDIADVWSITSADVVAKRERRRKRIAVGCGLSLMVVGIALQLVGLVESP